MNKQVKMIFFPLFAGQVEESRALIVNFFLLCLCFLFACCTEADSLMDRCGATVNFSLGSSTETPEVVPTRADEVNMKVGTTVRVLAYRRPDGSGSAELSSANYAGEAVYQVKLGGALELCGVTFDANGFPSVDAGATPPPLQLITGTYDFYAVTPALAVDHSDDNPTLDVRHRTDYAVSVTSKSISPTDNTVGLATLERRCTLLSFSTDRKADASDITKVVMGDVLLTSMPNEPMKAVATDALNVADNTNGTTFTVSAAHFGIPDNSFPYKAYGETPCLPKSAGKFDLKVNVTLGGATTPVLLEAKDLSITLEEGKHYAFTIRFKSTGIELLVGVEDWTDAIGSTQIGGNKLPVQIVVGEWTDVDWSTGIGGSKFPPFTPNVENWGDLNNKLNIGERD